MKKRIGSFLLKVAGWKVIIEGDVNNLDRCVLVTAPHTSNWDFFYGVMTYWKLGKNPNIIIKDSHTKAFYGGFIKRLGGIGIDRSQRNDLVNFIADKYKEEDLSLVITPEGSRSYAEKWKLGFYHIAKTAKVPIVFATGDYKHKFVKIGKKIPFEFIENSSFEDVMLEIQEYFKQINPKYPEKYNPSIF